MNEGQALLSMIIILVGATFILNAIVIGPNESVANLILKKADAQITAKKINNE